MHVVEEKRHWFMFRCTTAILRTPILPLLGVDYIVMLQCIDAFIPLPLAASFCLSFFLFF